MDELVMVMQEILMELRGINYKLNSINGIYGLDDIHRRLDDVCSSVGEMKGDGLWNSLSDVCDKLDKIDSSIDILR